MPEPSKVPPNGRSPGSTRTGDGPPSGRDRLVRALLRPSRSQTVVAVLLAVLAFAGITQVRANQVDATFAGYREQDLIDVLTGLSGTSQRAEAEIRRLERTREQLLSTTSRRRSALDQARSEAETLRILAGLVPVTGPGLRITIKEESSAVGADTLLDMVQELRTAGAEAMEVNDEVRLVAQSSFEDSVGGIVVDGKLLTAPYVFEVVGEPHGLETALTFPLGPRYRVEEAGGSLAFEDVPSLKIETVREPVEPEYAVPRLEQ